MIQTAGITILTAAGCGGVWFSIEARREMGGFLFDNEGHPERFKIIYLIAFAGSVLLPMIPAGGWPYLVLFVGLALFSNQITGLFAGSVLLMITISLQGGGTGTFLLYFISGLVGIAVFSYVDRDLKIWIPLKISLMVQLVCLFVQEVLLANEVLNPRMFIIPIVNILVCLILFLVLLKFFSFCIIFGKPDIYTDLNDPESPLLVKLKEISEEEYDHAIHTAYLCDRIAKKLEMDDAAVKACGYYHRIGLIKGENTWENIRSILTEYKFPPEVLSVLKEYTGKNEKIISRETVVLLFCDTVISSVNYLFSKDSKVEINYQKIINTIFKNKLESGIIDNSRLSFYELKEMKKILVEEKLYYDFLR